MGCCTKTIEIRCANIRTGRVDIFQIFLNRMIIELDLFSIEKSSLYFSEIRSDCFRIMSDRAKFDLWRPLVKMMYKMRNKKRNRNIIPLELTLKKLQHFACVTVKGFNFYRKSEPVPCTRYVGKFFAI